MKAIGLYVRFGVLCSSVLFLLGCGDGGEGKQALEVRLQQAPQSVQRSVQVMGGVERLSSIRRMEATVLMDIALKDAMPYTNRFHVQVIFGEDRIARKITAVASTARGPLNVVLSRYSEVTAPCYECDLELQAAANQAFRIILQSLDGPWGAVAPGVHTSEATPDRVEGEDLLRVGVAGSAGAGAYYFRPDNGLLRYVSFGGDAPGTDGVITRYRYRMLPTGLAVPSVLTGYPIGKNVLVGSEQIFRAEFSDVRLYDTMY